MRKQLSPSPPPLAGLRGTTSKGRERGRKGGNGRGRGGDKTPPLYAPLIHISGYAAGSGKKSVFKANECSK